MGLIFLAMVGGIMGAEPKALVIVPEKLQGGTFEVGVQRQYEVLVRNQKREEARIQSVESDCDCLRITGKPETVKGEALLKLVYLSEKEVSARVNVKVRYSVGGRTEEVAMLFVAEVVPHEMTRFEIDADELIHRDGWVLVDVRSPDHFQRLRIPGSLNLPLFAIKTKGLLRTRSVVLVGGGNQEGSLVAEAAAMKAAGFNEVKVLKGGIRAWELAGGPLERVQSLNLAGDDAVPGVRSWALRQDLGNGDIGIDVPATAIGNDVPTEGGRLIPAENRITVRGVKLVGAPGGGVRKKGCGSCP